MVRFSVCISVGYTVSSVVVGDWRRLYVAGAPRFKHKGKVILFDLTPEGDVIITQALNGEQVAISTSLLYLFTLTPSPLHTHCLWYSTDKISIKPLAWSPILWVLQCPSFLSWSFIAFSLSPSSFTPHSCSLTINELIFILNKSKQVSFTQAASKIKVILRTKSTISVLTVMENLDKSGEF